MKPATTEIKAFLAALDLAIEFHYQNQNDPHGISNAVSIALLETRNAWARAHGLKELSGIEVGRGFEGGSA